MTGVSNPFADDRRLLLSIAYNITGSISDAEDLVQAGYLRWQARPTDRQVEHPRAYAAQIVTRLALDLLDSPARRNEQYVGPWLPEPWETIDVPEPASEHGPHATAELSERVSTALLVVLHTLSEDQRAAFVLHDVFGFSYPETAASIQKSEAATRQILHRAREHVKAGRPRIEVSAREHRQTVQRFADAASTGDVQSLLSVIAPNAILVGDGGGKANAVRRPVLGRVRILRFLLGIWLKRARDTVTTIRQVNGRDALVINEHGRTTAVFEFDVLDDGVAQILVQRNPDKLARFDA
ncbi:RNA polymerase sigma factor SigJ [Lysinibacter cavernae]|uniref:RNA polymerase sigma-70 factor (ECF subfamily) n=1 Tax=Lysinibacter cavernae TaxID=1640652 RepID=A0A7X5TSV7_9MICO|nr:RNA polymerase sigma factor SigJ [Lysinibacter cavernae]NIH52869.1 RNA polymerase sigma-70 factor (ECF subfamily) [Lysinibacter cavernae]